MTAQTHISANEDIPSFVKRIQALEQEKATISIDIAAVYHEAKSKNFNVKALRETIKLLKLEDMKRKELSVDTQYYLDIIEGN